MKCGKVLKWASEFERRAADKPEGWTEESFKKWWKEVTDKNSVEDMNELAADVERCVKKMKDEEGIDNPYAFCNWMKNKAEK